MTTIMTKKERLSLAARKLADGGSAPKRARASAYEAASRGRRLQQWRASSGGPNSLLLGNLDTLRPRSRDAVRNNGWISGALESWVANEVGTGIVPRSQAADPEFAAAADALWGDWTKEADADGLLDFYGLLALAVRSRKEAGEVFIRRRTRRPEDGLVVPLQLQLLESELCPLNHSSGEAVRAGIEFDGVGRRRAYHMYGRHPGEHGGEVDATKLRPVPADAIIHHFAPLRPGQLRGQPWTVQALIRSRSFDEYDDAELERKKTRSAYTGTIERQDDPALDHEDPLSGGDVDLDADGAGMSALEAGSFLSLLPGEKANLFDGDSTGQGYADFCRQQLLGMAVGLKVPYEFFTGDFKGVNDRVMRVILSEYHRILEQSQWLLTIPQVCERVWEWFIDHAVMAGKLRAPDYAARRREYLRVEWRTDGWPYMHPVQDVQAKLMAIEGGLESRPAAVAERGWSYRDVDRQNAEAAEHAEQHGLQYSHDPGVTEDDDAPNELA